MQIPLPLPPKYHHPALRGVNGETLRRLRGATVCTRVHDGALTRDDLLLWLLVKHAAGTVLGVLRVVCNTRDLKSEKW